MRCACVCGRTPQQPNQPNGHFNLREHILLFYTALHDRNIAVDFARPVEDLSAYRIVIAPSLHLLADGEAGAHRAGHFVWQIDLEGVVAQVQLLQTAQLFINHIHH